MITYLKGTVLDPSTILVGGVGYHVATPSCLAEGDEVELWIRETGTDRTGVTTLWGFPKPEHRDLFDALCTAKGIGPAKSMEAMQRAGFDLLVQAVDAGNSAVLTDAKVLGKATADKLVDVKLPASIDPALANVTILAASARQTLVSLGYAEADIENAASTAVLPATPGEQVTVLIQELSR